MTTTALTTTGQRTPAEVSTEPPDRNPFRVYLARLAPGSRPTMAEALGMIARIASGGRLEAEVFPWATLRYQHTQAIRTALVNTVSPRTGRPLSPASINKALSALRGVLREAWRLGQLSAEDLARATDLEPVRGSRPLRGRALAPHELARLFHVCQEDATPAGPRDAVILALGVGAGLRRAEIAGLDLADLDFAGERVRVHGKGNKVREVPVKGGTLEAIRAWLAHRREESGPLVCPVRKGGRVVLERLSPQAVLRVCEKRAREAGVEGFMPHDLRRTYISTLLDRGADLSVASELAGHASPTTTKRYDRRGERARHEAAATVVVPYVWNPGRAE
ncbi:MAG: site-specific integrase [Candidatus Rokubacteria bacterium]|nr:site-specific integrase [Candidatus Rokubacteria bacterium]